MENLDSGTTKRSFSEPAVGGKFKNVELIKLILMLKSGETLNRGRHVSKFEEKLSEVSGCEYAVSTTSCSSALFLVPKLLRLKKGDKVLVPANVFWTAVAPLLERGVVCVPFEVNRKDLNADFEDMWRKWKENQSVRAVYVQSFGGSPYEGPKFREFCDREGIFLVEDSAHGIGARIGNVPIQSYSHLACLSFSTLKNIVTLGEGGAIVTNTPEFGEEAKKLVESRALGTGHIIERDLIWKGTREEDRRAIFRPGDAFDWSWLSVEEIGLTLRLNAPAALMGCLQLDRLKTILRKRQNQRDYYASKLNILRTSENWLMGESIGSSNHLVNLYVNDEKTREKILKSMGALGYAPVIRYLPISYQSVPRWFGLKPGMTPVYEDIFFRHLISLPIGPRLTRSLQKNIIRAVNLATS